MEPFATAPCKEQRAIGPRFISWFVSRSHGPKLRPYGRPTLQGIVRFCPFSCCPVYRSTRTPYQPMHSPRRLLASQAFHPPDKGRSTRQNLSSLDFLSPVVERVHQRPLKRDFWLPASSLRQPRAIPQQDRNIAGAHPVLHWKHRHTLIRELPHITIVRGRFDQKVQHSDHSPRTARTDVVYLSGL